MAWQHLGALLRRKTDWIQVEVSTHCHAACIYCPRTAYRDVWTNRHLSPEIFHKLLPSFARTRLVYLQGWGEPLLHPDFFRLVALAKQAGCRVGATTNGMFLDEGKIIDLVESGLDLLAFSLAGTSEKNDLVRRGTHLQEVLQAMGRLTAAKAQRGKATPEIHVAYMLLRSAMTDLEGLPELLGGLGVSQVVVSTLDFVPTRELAGETVRPADPQEYRQMQSWMAGVAAAGRRYGLQMHCQLQEPGRRRPACTENVQRALCVAVDGGVAPCVYHNLPVARATFMAGGVEGDYQRLTFGNVLDRPLEDIWGQPDYTRFRRSFARGRLYPSCRVCAKL